MSLLRAHRGLRSHHLTDYPEVPEGFFKVAFDLDGTIAQKVWPEPHIGPVIPDGVDCLLHYVEQGYECIILTARPESHFPRIWEWLRVYGLFNTVYDVTNVKASDVGLFIDDRSWRPPWA